MKAIIYKRYGAPEVLLQAEVAKPTPKDNEILVRVHATAANSGDVRLRKADPWAVRLFFGLSRPRIQTLGGVFSGTVEQTGKNVTRFRKGDEVFGSTGMSFGAYAEYKCLPENGILSIKPANISHSQASTIPFGACTALHFLKKAKIKPGQKVLVYGASSAVGSAAVQLAKYYGAHVTGVCSGANVEMVKSLGADAVIDYTKDDFTQGVERYDVIFEAVNKLQFSRSLGALTQKGILILGAAGMADQLHGVWTSITTDRRVISGIIQQTAEDVSFLRGLVERGIYKPVVDRTYLLEEMAEAHAYVETGRKKGNVSITVIQDRN